MKAWSRSFGMFMRQIVKDGMLFAVILAPLLTALFFYCGVPYAEKLLCSYLKVSSLLSGYYPLFDVFLCIVTPYMFCMAASMAMLDEYDENMSAYLAVTPVGKSGYIISRLWMPAAISFPVSAAIVSLFSLSRLPFLPLVSICFLGSVSGVVIALLLFSFSRNRVEGMAMAKLSGLFMAGLLVPFFIRSPAQYLFSLLPSFWISKIYTDGSLLPFLPAVLSTLLWMLLLYDKFQRKFV